LGYEFEQFLIDFFDIENWKVGLRYNCPEKFWMIEIQKFFWQMKVQPKILDDRHWLLTLLPLKTAKLASLKNDQWKRIVPSSLDLKVINPIGIFCSRRIERYQNHENQTSETYLKLIQFYLITLVKNKCQGYFLGRFCVWSYVFPSFAWNGRSPVAI